MNKKIEKIEIQLLLEAIFLKYGYDFRNYSKGSLERRIMHRYSISKFENMAEMQHKIITDPQFFRSVLLDLSINVTEMFRNPPFYRAVRETVIPILKTYPFIKVWHAGCSTGEEVYSMAILLKEENLLDRAIIYATDINEVALEKAQEGIFSLDQMKNYTLNYQNSGGKESFSNYYTAKYDLAIMDNSLKKNLVFSLHNLATDSDFGEVNLMICRNVLIYFNRELQNRAIGLFHNSLVRKGILCLGSKESIRFSSYEDKFEDLLSKRRIYRKK